MRTTEHVPAILAVQGLKESFENQRLTGWPKELGHTYTLSKSKPFKVSSKLMKA